MNYTFIYKVNPVTVNHYWMIRCIKNRPIVHKTKKSFEYKEFLRWSTISQLKEKGIKNPLKRIPLFKKPQKVSLSIEYFYSRKPKDIDNILKALIDSLEEILFENDSQIVELYIVKRKDKENFLRITISEKE